MLDVFVLDKASILERLGGDQSIFAMMVDMYIADVERNCSSLALALASGEALTLAREAHTVKGLLATFSDEAGAAVALVIERQARQGDIAGIDAAVSALQARLREIAGVLAAGQV